VNVASSAIDGPNPANPLGGWDCHVHLFDVQASVIGGHYQPALATLPMIEALAGEHGVHHLVLVQPSVYGTNNGLLLQALRDRGGRHRGVVVVNDVPADLPQWHAWGVRGVRINRVSPVGRTAALDALLPAILQSLSAPLRRLAWHVQWYVSPEELAALVPLQASCGLPFVLDHVGGLHAKLPTSASAWHALAALAQAGAWLKLSGWYRLQAPAPYRELHATIERAAQLFGDRLVWGSDWPHTSFVAGAAPPYAAMWQPVVDVLGAARAEALRHSAPLVLYG
jgi:predicted TIM-barrel fold metal-dependent hydrolase